jgi:hypothetical protein
MSARMCRCLLFVLVVVGVVFGGVGSAWGGLGWWHLQSGSRPSFLAPGSTDGQIVASVTNLGDASAGGVVTITDELPEKLSAKSIEGEVLEGTGGEGLKAVACSPHPLVEKPLVCRVTGLAAYEAVEVRIGVTVDPGAVECKQNAAECEQNRVSVSAAGTPSALVSRPVTVSGEPVPFGVESYEVAPEEEGGGPAVQAGGHPFQVTGTLTMNQTVTTAHGYKDKLEAHPVALAKDLAGLLPPGLIGTRHRLRSARLRSLIMANARPRVWSASRPRP